MDLVLVTGHASVDTAVQALRGGATDYLTKPIDVRRLEKVLAHVQRAARLRGQVGALREELRGLGRFGRMIGASTAMQAVYDQVLKVARTDATVLVTGETGTGKELVAETLHELSARAEGPFVPLNCGAISPNLIESELFGHEKGSFTGATERRFGCFERADGGTLFLDEITEMSTDLQVKLLRALESSEVQRVGGNESDQGRRARGRGHEPRSASGGGRRLAARGPALPAARVPDPPAAAAQPRRRSRPARRLLPRPAQPPRRHATRSSRAPRASGCAITAGPATCASCAT